MQQTLKKYLIVLCITAVCITGCGSDILSKVTYVKLTDQEEMISSLTADRVGILKISFADDIQSMVLYVDTWKDGVCIDSKLLAYSEKQDNTFYISMKTKREDTQYLGTEWNVSWKDIPNGSMTLGPVSVNFDEHEQTDGRCMITFLGEETGAYTFHSENKYMLAIQGYKFADSIVFSSCEAFVRNPELLGEYDYAVVLRMDTFADVEGAKAAFDAQNALMKQDVFPMAV